ncbi:MAG: DUF2293 domain-containing protein, partial [bacterium]|nr:DUF2293 domain-containing protein [bacterium]
TFYRKYGRGVKVKLRFSKSGKPVIEKAYRTHYVSPELSEAKKQKLEEKLGKPPEMVVFQNLRDARCSECGAEIGRGGFLYMDAGEPLCLPCAGFGVLEYLPAGNATLTRRARKKSEKSAVVVKFSRSRKRYERQGLLVEEQAIVSAENECEEDADQRAYVRARAAEQRKRHDARLVKQMVEQIAELFPGCPPDEVRAIAAHTAVRGSGRVGRTAAGKALEEEALTLAVGAAIRHRHTNYDELIASGQDRAAARARVDEILDEWREGR